MDPKTIPLRVETLRQTFDSGRTRPRAWREEQLHKLAAMIREAEPSFFDALRADLGKPPLESFASETGFLLGEIRHALSHLGSWMKPRRVGTPLLFKPARARVHREPLGVVLIIGPWNYPLQLVLAPLVGALAAGNCAVLKPSELAPRTSAAVAEAIPKYLDPEAVAVVEGGPQETQVLLAQKFDHLFYTGGPNVGRIVMQAAAQHLTPVTLELGGKSPCLVARDADLRVAGRRIVWGKFWNAGQTCVAPDYVLVEEPAEAELLVQMRAALTAFYGPDPRQSPDYPRIVNVRHFRRLVALMGAGEIVVGGEAEESERYLAPTLLRAVPEDAPVMSEEIFGPILPVLTVRDLDEGMAFVNRRAHPLALYLFTSNRREAKRVIANTSSGGACINDTMVHLSVRELPFGGVGESGMGAYHGRTGFETFSHRRSVLKRSTLVDPAVRYPPYTDKKLKMARRML